MVEIVLMSDELGLSPIDSLDFPRDKMFAEYPLGGGEINRRHTMERNLMIAALAGRV